MDTLVKNRSLSNTVKGTKSAVFEMDGKLQNSHLYVPLLMARLYLGTLSKADFQKALPGEIVLSYETQALIKLHKLEAIVRTVVLQHADLFRPYLSELLAEEEAILYNKKIEQIAEIRRIQKAFSTKGIFVSPYKGIALGKEFYRNINQRDNADIDFAINKRDIPISAQVMTELGYKEQKGESDYHKLSNSRSYYVDYEWCLMVNGRVKHIVEFHWQAGFSALYCPHVFDLKKADKQILVIEDQQVETISKSSHALICIIHHGLVDGWGELRHLVDFVKLLEKLDKAALWKLIEDTKKYKIHKIFCLGLTLAKVLLAHENQWLKAYLLNKNKVQTIIKAIDNQSIVGDWSQKPTKLYFYLSSRDNIADTLKSIYRFGAFAIKEIQFKLFTKRITTTEKSIPMVQNLEHIGINKNTKLTRFSFSQIKYKNDWFTHLIPLWEHYLLPLINIPQPKILEIGSYEGLSTCWLIENIIKPTDGHITCIDIGFQPNFEHNIKAINGLPYLTKYEADSKKILVTLPDDQYDLIYVDGLHTEEQVSLDARLSWPLLKMGGIMVFDDYEHDVDFGVKIAVNEFVEQFKDELKVLHVAYQYIIQKLPIKNQVGANDLKVNEADILSFDTRKADPYFPKISSDNYSPKILFLLATERSGSTLLALSLAKLIEISGGIEYFDWQSKNPAAFGDRPLLEESILAFINLMKIEQKYAKVLCIKILWKHYEYFLKKGIDLIQVIEPNYLIHLSREDRLLQAISNKIAADELAYSKNETIKKESYYDYLKIKDFKLLAERNNQQIKDRLASVQIPIFATTYEQFTANYYQELKTITTFLNINSPTNIDSLKQPILKQGNQRNIEWKNRFLDEY